MREYLHTWDHISKKKKTGWRIVELGRNIEQAFHSGNTFVRWAISDEANSNLIVCFYHTPVTKKLRMQGEKLGNFLHCMKWHQASNDNWWSKLRTDLVEIARALRIANMGTLLGPPIMKGRTGRVQMNMEVPPGRSIESLMEVGQRRKIHVSYRPSLPDLIEPEAIIWTTSVDYPV